MAKILTIGPELFFNLEDAYCWASDFIDDNVWDYNVKEFEIKLLPSGAYRIGATLVSKQGELFGE